MIYADFVQQVGIDDDQIESVRGFPADLPVRAGRPLPDGDVTIRNVGVYSYRPITVGLFDLNSLSGDPSRDTVTHEFISSLVNRMAA